MPTEAQDAGQRLLSSLVAALNSSTPKNDADTEAGVAALRNVQHATALANKLAQLEAELSRAHQETIDRRLGTVAEGLVDMLSDGLEHCVGEIAQLVEAETGFASDEVLEIIGADFDHLCEEMVDSIVTDGIRHHLRGAALDHISTSVRQALLAVYGRSADELQRMLIARRALQASEVERLPVSAARRKAGRPKSMAVAFTLARSTKPAEEDQEEGSVTFEKLPQAAGAVDANPQLVHQTKARPRQGVGRCHDGCNCCLPLSMGTATHPLT